MVGLNKVMLIGSVGREPEIRYCSNGTALTCFSLGVERTWAGADGERREAIDWFNVVAWRRLAGICAHHLRKGSRVYVEGRLETRSWEDPQGQRHYRTEVVAGNMILLDGPGGRNLPEGAVEALQVNNGAGGSTPGNDREV